MVDPYQLAMRLISFALLASSICTQTMAAETALKTFLSPHGGSDSDNADWQGNTGAALDIGQGCSGSAFQVIPSGMMPLSDSQDMFRDVCLRIRT